MTEPICYQWQDYNFATLNTNLKTLVSVCKTISGTNLAYIHFIGAGNRFIISCSEPFTLLCDNTLQYTVQDAKAAIEKDIKYINLTIERKNKIEQILNEL